MLHLGGITALHGTSKKFLLNAEVDGDNPFSFLPFF